MTGKNIIKIDVEALIHGEPYQVFNAITTGTAIWWGTSYLQRQDARDLVMEPKVGGRFYERWTLSHSDSKGALHATVTAIDPPTLLRLQGPFGMTDRAAIGTLTIELTSIPQGTHISFSYHAFGEVGDELEEQYTNGWNDLIRRLKSYVEQGESQGIKDPSLSLD